MVPVSITTESGTLPKAIPAKPNIKTGETGKWLKLLSFLDSGLWELCLFMNGGTKMNPWEYCNSLRYGFDDDYDVPLFEEEDDE